MQSGGYNTHFSPRENGETHSRQEWIQPIVYALDKNGPSSMAHSAPHKKQVHHYTPCSMSNL